MKLRLEDKRKAIELRRVGYTYNEIREVIPNLSKGTLSGWLKNIELSLSQRERILEKIKTGSEYSRLRGAWTNKKKSTERIARIQNEAQDEFEKYNSNQLFKVFLSLYWAEGAKKSRGFQFINSDPEMVKLVLYCLRFLFKLSEKEIRVRLYIHQIYSGENCEEYWSRTLGIPVNVFKKTVYKPTVHHIKKNLGYKGCCRLDVIGSEFYWKVEKWIKMMVQSYP